MSITKVLREIWHRFKSFLRNLANFFRGTKNPWDDVESSARLFRLKREGQLQGQMIHVRSLRHDLLEQVRRNPPQDFGQVVRLIQLVTEKPIILTPLRCSNCGADIQLPSSGQYLRCSHCGHDYHVTNVTEMLERIL
jgi:hypothetical protein